MGTGQAARRGRLYYGWVLVGTLALTEMTSWGILYYGFSVFLPPMEAELGWSRSLLSGAFSLALLLSGIAAIPVGRLLDRQGPRVLMTIGSVAATLLTAAWATVADPVVFYLIWAGIGLTMAAVLYEPAFVVVANWFSRRRGRALTILTFVAGFASVVYIPLAGWLVREQGWRAALLTLAALLAVGTIPLHALVLRRRPADLGLPVDGFDAAPPPGAPPPPPERNYEPRQALREPAFWWLTAAFCLNMLGAVAVTIHLVPFLIDGGYGQEFAVFAAGLVGLMALPGRLIFTPLGDRFPRSFIAATLFMLQTVALVVLLTVRHPAGVIAFVTIFGAGFGAITPARVALLAEFFGPAHYGAISGVLAFFVTGARAVAPVGAGAGHDLFGTYDPVFWSLALISAVGAVAVVLAHASIHRRDHPSAPTPSPSPSGSGAG